MLGILHQDEGYWVCLWARKERDWEVHSKMVQLLLERWPAKLEQEAAMQLLLGTDIDTKK